MATFELWYLNLYSTIITLCDFKLEIIFQEGLWLVESTGEAILGIHMIRKKRGMEHVNKTNVNPDHY